MKKLLFGILSLGLFFSAVAVAGAGLYYAKSNDFFFPQINERFEQATGYAIEKEGLLEVTLLPRLKLTARNLKLGNPSSPMGTPLLKTEHLSLALDWLSILRLDIAIDIELDTSEIDLQIDDSGLANWSSSKLQANSAGLPFKLENIDAKQTRFRFRNKQTQEILGLDLDQIDIDLLEGRATTQVNTAGRYGNTRFLAQGELKYDSKDKQLGLNMDVRAGVAGDKNVATIKVPSISDWIEQHAASLPMHGTLEGSLSIEDLLPHGSLNFDVEAQSMGDISFLDDNLKYLRKEIGPIVASGVLRFNGSDLDIMALEAELHGQESLNIEVIGTTQDLLSNLQADLKVKGRVGRLDQLLASSPLTVIDPALISRLEDIDFNAVINNLEPGIQVNDMNLSFRHGGFEANIAGSIELSKASVLTKLKIEGRTEKINDFMGLVGIENTLSGDPGPLTISAVISSENDQYLIKNSTLIAKDNQMKATASGSLNVANSGLSFNLDSDVEFKNFSLLAAIIPEDLQSYLQGVNGNVSGNINGTVENFSIRNAAMDLYHDNKTLHLEGQLSQLPDNLITDISVRYLTEEPIDLEQYFSELRGLQLTGPLELSGIVGTINSKIFIQQLRLQAQQTDVAGEIIIDLGLNPPRISATLNSEQFVTSLVENEPQAIDLQINGKEIEKPDPGAEPEVKTQDQKKLSAKELGEHFRAYTSSIAIKTDWIDQLDLYISYSAARAHVSDYKVDNLALTIGAREGVFTLFNYELMLDDKPISFSGFIDTNTEPPEFEFTGKLAGDTLEMLLNVEDGLLEGGQLTGNFEFKSKGGNIGQLIENLDGNALITMGPLTIRSEALNFVSSSVFSAMLGGIIVSVRCLPSLRSQFNVLQLHVGAV